MKVILLLFALTLSFLLQNDIYSQNRGGILWNKMQDNNVSQKGKTNDRPIKYLTFQTDFNNLKAAISDAPFEFTDAARSNPMIIELPYPTGELKKFYVTEYSMMEYGLAKQFPEMKTYSVKGLDDPYAVGKLDVTMLGFHAMILSPNGDFFIDPVNFDNNVYMTYFKSDYPMNEQRFECLVKNELDKKLLNSFNNSDVTGQQLRTYRLACAATGEYTAFFGGTAALGQAAIVTAVNRVNQVYERDASVRMTLVANNINVVYTNSTTDPYTNNNGVAMLSQNQTNLDAVIGSANYDIGHVFSTGGGGVAGLGVVCLSGNKARGVTGSPSPVGDPFYIDYVAHEMGHQFSGNHTFNSTVSNCGGGNRNGSTAWEPGSGSTVMAYAGICGADDLQPNSDAYFHTGSCSEIATFTQSGSGNSCPVTTSTGNTPPSVTVPSGGFTIPINTPFQLTGSATDIENPGSLTYCWEEFDIGPAGSPNSPSGNAPIFRSFSPVTSSTRTFPKLSDILNNTQTLGEILPSYSRNLSFRLTVRDNNSGAGGINFGTITFAVSNTSGPFTVTQPNTAVSWLSSSPQTITWNVANTTAAPVNCSQVNIKLSTDGGLTFPTTLISNTANDGTESVTLPNVVTTQARIRVEASANIFFDISNSNFSINSTGPSLCENFSSALFPPSGWGVEYTGTLYWSRNAVSAYGSGSGSAKFNFWNAASGTAQSLLSLSFNNSLTGDSLKFDNAYAPYTDGSTDSLEILYSVNGGSSYTTLVRLHGNNTTGTLNTAAASGSEFTPTSAQWASRKYALPVGTNKVKFRARSGFGNNLYLDNICVSNNAAPVASTITLAEQGYYNTSTSRLNMRDTVRIYLRSILPPYTVIDSGKAVVDSVTLNAVVTFSNAVSGSYFVVVRHRNALETWSKAGGQSYIRGSSFSFNFTTAQNQTYGNNTILKGTKYCFYSGDVDQNYAIDGTDVSIIDNDAYNFAGGYIPSDLTGDGIVDGQDLLVADNNSYNFITRQAP